MISWKLRVIATLLIGLVGTSEASDPKNISDAELIKGTWVQVKVTHRGTTIPGLDFLEWHFRDDRYTLHSPGVSTEFRYRLDPTRSPKTIDVWYEGDDQEKKEAFDGGIRGIYKFEGGRLIRCYSQSGEPRPTKFESKVGTSLILDVLERKDADDGANK